MPISAGPFPMILYLVVVRTITVYAAVLAGGLQPLGFLMMNSNDLFARVVMLFT